MNQPGGAAFAMAMRSMRRDDTLKSAHIRPGTAKRMMRFAAPYKRTLAWFLILIVFDSLIGVANPLLYRAIINNGIIDKNAHLIVVLAIVVALLALGDAVLSIFERYASAKVGEGLIYDMRSKVFAHIQEMPVAFFTRTQTGALISRLNNDVLGAQSAFTNTLSSVVSNLLTVVLVLGAMFFLSWQITLASLVIVPLFILPAKWVGRKLSAITRESYNLNASMTNTMTERFNVAGAVLVKLFGRPEHELGNFQSRAARVRDIGITQAMYSRFFFVALILTASIATAIVYGWGGVLAVKGELTVGTLVALTAYLGRLYGPLTSLSNIQVDIMTALVSFDRVFEVLDLEPMIKQNEEAIELPDVEASIDFDHVDFTYPSAKEVSLASLESVAVLDSKVPQQVLFDVSFRVEPGEMVALVGPSGAGKTTLSSLIPRLYDVTGGAIRINGVDIREATLASLNKMVGVVTQDAHLFHDTIRANLLYAKPDATEEEMYEALSGAQILDLVESLEDGLDTVVGDRGYRLSGGEKQRIAIARLLLKAPKIVVLDEATAHLDSESELQVQEALRQALKGRSSIVIAHRLSTIREASKIVVLEKGHVVQVGTHDQLLQQGGLYAELYAIQFASQSSETDSTITNYQAPIDGDSATPSQVVGAIDHSS
ncbi:ATP-binding cassette, subfamily B [Ferrithrix thermotolerans DSM 19514]|uniref:ATP-binding cassette, subfamily B n=1 Tax=Ferrithrix thermotolerans DSM 19514 TaxID=1121881 RepID=A0A1M4WRT0_9ACTN|nr:ABC transporter ATP-binding protein [Ferrithrix thermotolerans]SHE83867.1 ATP-binding cassette, subfamily B [Ferrithrix thermotolerans DSM 19514]